MKITMQAGTTASDLSSRKWDYAVYGDPIDARGRAAVGFAKTNAKDGHLFRYNSQTLRIEFDGTSYSAEEPEAAFARLHNASALIEATTLSFVEILLCCRALNELRVQDLSILYTEPHSYFRPERTQLVHRRSFELSDEVEDFTSVPGNSILIMPERPLKTAVFLGFEGQRLGRLLEQTGISPSSCSIVFGVPAYNPGWEMDAFVNNLRVLSGQQMAGRVNFCGAHNALSAYENITKIYASCSDERLLVAPIGTKPHGIGSALFLCEHPNVGVVYDNPKRKKDRSDKVGSWHLFEARF